MLIEHAGRAPEIDASAYVAPNAVVSGDVRVGAGCRILFGAVLTAEDGPVRLGQRCIVMENAVVRGRREHPAELGDDVLVGPHAHVNGARVETRAFVATGASIFPGAVVGSGAEVRINAVVHVNTAVGPGAVVPIGWVAVGAPASILPPDAHDEIWAVQQSLDFIGTVTGIPADERTDPAGAMGELIGVYARLYGRHRDDRVLSP